MPKKILEDMSFDELALELQSARAEVEEKRKKAKQIRALMDRRIIEDEVRRKVEGMSDAEKQALHQYIGVNAATGVSVGISGSKQ